MMKKICKIIFVISCLLSFGVKAEILSNDDPITHIEFYLNSLSSYVAQFEQVSSDGQISKGKFYLKRPDKIRWQYDTNVPVLIIINKNHLTYFDYELDEITHTKLEDNLSNILTRKNIKFSDDILIKNFDKQQDLSRLTIVNNDKDMPGSLTLEFMNNPLQLNGLSTDDGNGNVSLIHFNKIVENSKVANELFHTHNLRKQKL